MENINLADYGLAGAAFAFMFMIIDRGFKALTVYLERKKPDNKAADVEQKGYNKEILDALAEIKTSMTEVKVKVETISSKTERLEKTVIDGNGHEPLVIRVERIDERLTNHIGDRGLHTAER